MRLGHQAHFDDWNRMWWVTAPGWQFRTHIDQITGETWRLISSARHPRADHRHYRTPSHDLVQELIDFHNPHPAVLDDHRQPEVDVADDHVDSIHELAVN